MPVDQRGLTEIKALAADLREKKKQAQPQVIAAKPVEGRRATCASSSL